MASPLSDRWRLPFQVLIWALVGVLVAELVHVVLGLSWPLAFLFGVPLGLVAAPVSLSTVYLCRAMPLPGTSTLRVAATSLTAAIITAGVWAALGRAWWVTLVRGNAALGSVPVTPVTTILVGLGVLAYLLSVALQYLVQSFEHAAEIDRRALESEVAQREAELRALRAQVDPHFLFNSLNSISGLIGADPAKARQMCQLLADFLRESLTVGSARRIPLNREVALAEQYLRIEQVRFGDRLQVRTAVALDGRDLSVPPLILQPLVENAVRHGIATRLDGGAIEIAARLAGNHAVIIVANPRDPDATRKGTGLGLENVRRRLAAAFGDRAALSVEVAAESYRVALSLPLEESGT